MKAKVSYLAIHEIVIDIDERFSSTIKNDDEATEAECDKMVDWIDNYIMQIDPDFSQSCGMEGIDFKGYWDWN